MSFGNSVEVLQPAFLIEEIKANTEKIIARYGKIEKKGGLKWQR